MATEYKPGDKVEKSGIYRARLMMTIMPRNMRSLVFLAKNFHLAIIAGTTPVLSW